MQKIYKRGKKSCKKKPPKAVSMLKSLRSDFLPNYRESSVGPLLQIFGVPIKNKHSVDTSRPPWRLYSSLRILWIPPASKFEENDVKSIVSTLKWRWLGPTTRLAILYEVNIYAAGSTCGTSRGPWAEEEKLVFLDNMCFKSDDSIVWKNPPAVTLPFKLGGRPVRFVNFYQY